MESSYCQQAVTFFILVFNLQLAWPPHSLACSTAPGCGEAYSDIHSIHQIICADVCKRWLNLPCNCTPGTVFHCNILDLQFFPHLKESAMLSYILAIECSVDLIIVELHHS